jgi:chromosome segregation ATPase
MRTKNEAPDLAVQLAQAQAEANAAHAAYDELDARLKAAVQAGEYLQADELKQQLPAAETALVMATAYAAKLAAVAGQLEQRERERRQEAEHARQVEQARADADAHGQRARDAEELMDRRLAEARAGIDAVREALQEALTAEATAGQAIHDQEASIAFLEDRPPVPWGRPNRISNGIQNKPLLRALYDARSSDY